MPVANNTVTRRRFALGAMALAASAVATGRVRTAAASEEQARAHVVSLIEQAMAILDDSRSDDTQRAAGFRRLLHSYFDLPMMTRVVIGRHWRAATGEQKQAFAGAFEEHVVGIYAAQLAAYDGETVVIRNVVTRTERDAIVFTEIQRPPDPPISIDWLVRHTEQDYRIIDVAAEGVSMVATKREEFAAVIARQGLDGLIVSLRRLNAADAEES